MAPPHSTEKSKSTENSGVSYGWNLRGNFKSRHQCGLHNSKSVLWSKRRQPSPYSHLNVRQFRRRALLSFSRTIYPLPASTLARRTSRSGTNMGHRGRRLYNMSREISKSKEVEDCLAKGFLQSLHSDLQATKVEWEGINTPGQPSSDTRDFHRL